MVQLLKIQVQIEEGLNLSGVLNIKYFVLCLIVFCLSLCFLFFLYACNKMWVMIQDFQLERECWNNSRFVSLVLLAPKFTKFIIYMIIFSIVKRIIKLTISFTDSITKLFIFHNLYMALMAYYLFSAWLYEFLVNIRFSNLP